MSATGLAQAHFKPPTTGAEDGADEIAQIKKVLAEIIAADNASDVERIVALYDEDAVLPPPVGLAVVGKAAIKERYRQGFEKANTSRVPQLLECAILRIYDVLDVKENSSGRELTFSDVAIWDIGTVESSIKRASCVWREIC